MNPIVRKLLDNIGRLGRELQRVESQTDRPQAPEANNDGRSNVEGEVARIFRGSSVQPAAQAREQSLRKGEVVAPILHRSESNLLNKGKEVARILRRLHAFGCLVILTTQGFARRAKPAVRHRTDLLLRTLFCLADHNTKMFPDREPRHGSCKTVTLFRGPSF